MSMMRREVAWRIFADELNNSTLETSGEDERAPTYVVSPLGAKVNRVYAVGVLTEVDNRGTEEEPLWQGRVSDPTGTFFISAGRYQPDAATSLSNIDPPKFVAVVGKTSTYRPDDETVLISIRAELVKEVNEEQRDHWILEAAKGLKTRLEAMGEAARMEDVSVQELIDLGYDPTLADGINIASEHYQTYPVERYWSVMKDALRYVLPEYEEPTVTDSPEEGMDEGLMESVLEIIKELEEEAEEDGVNYEEVRDIVVEREGISMTDFEEIVSKLRMHGKLMEPALGQIQSTY